MEDEREDFCAGRSKGNKATISATNQTRLILRYPEHDGIVLGIIEGTKREGKKKGVI